MRLIYEKNSALTTLTLISISCLFTQKANGGEKPLVKSAEGIILSEKYRAPERDVNAYKLFFPDVEKINLLRETWKIFDIDSIEKESTSFIPKLIQGNWLKTDGSNEWSYGIYEDKVIYQNKIWHNILLSNKGKTYELILKDGSQQEKIYIKIKKKNLLIGSSPENQQLYSKVKTYKPHYIIENEEIQLPIFKIDTAVYSGFINGYRPKMGETGMAYVNDIIINEQKAHLIAIEPDGSFMCKIPMIYPQEVFIRILNIHTSIYLEPGVSTFHYIESSEYISANKNHNDRDRRMKSLFMGETARVNSDLRAMDTISYFNFKQAYKVISNMSGKEFKSYCLEVMKKEQNTLSQFVNNNQVSKKALQIKNMQIPYRAYRNVLSFSQMKRSAYRKKNNIPREQRDIPLEAETFDPDFYDFINPDDLNTPISLIAGSAYTVLINRIRFSESILPKPNFFHVALKDSITKKSIPLTQEEEKLIDDLIACKNRKCINEIINSNKLIQDSFMQKHPELISAIGKNAFQQIQSINIKNYFGLDDGFIADIMFAQSMYEGMKGSQKPFGELDKKEIKENIENKFIVDYLMLCSDGKEKDIEETLAKNKTATGYIINETPKTKSDKLFSVIMEKYKGKVVFVDFWATWCGPCISGMKRIKPLKEELKEEDIEFVYITNQTSPLDTWNMMIPDIKGEHYRVEQDEWNHFASKFNISGIPHYVIVNKDGTVANDKVYFTSSNQELKKMFSEYLAK